MYTGKMFSMLFMLFTGSQPDFADVAQKLTPESKAEILTEVIKMDSIRMRGDSVTVLYGLDPKEYSYTNNYEFIQALNKYRGLYYGAINTSMVDSVMPIIMFDIRCNATEDSVGVYLRESFAAYLWHPEGIAVAWNTANRYIKIGSGDIIRSREEVEFVNKFLDEPYIFNINDRRLRRGFKTIGVLREGKMVIYDIDGGQYDGIEDMIIKKYGSIAEYIEVIKMPKIPETYYETHYPILQEGK